MKKNITLAIALILLGGCKEESSTKTGDPIPYTGPVWDDPITSINDTEHTVVPDESPENVYSQSTQVKVLTASLASSNSLTDTSFANTVLEIESVNPDIIFTQDASDKNKRLEKALGMYLWDGQDRAFSVGILSKFPIIEVFDTLSNPQIGAVLDINGRQVVVWSNHLSNQFDTSKDLRGFNTTLNETYDNCLPVTETGDLDQISAEGIRLKQTKSFVEFLAPYKESGTPIIFGGDFSVPSGLDWTADTASMFDHGGNIYDFPTHRAFLGAGYIDTYRALYRNAITHPGITWPLRQGDSELAANTITRNCGRALDDRDRVDFIYYDKSSRGVSLNSASIVGPKTTQFFVSPNEISPDPEMGYEDKHVGRLIDSETGESTYNPEDFPSSHMWYTATFIIDTPSDSTEHASLDSTSEIEIVSLENDNDDLKITFNIIDSLFMNSAFEYRVNATANTETVKSNLGGTKGVHSRPDGTENYELTIGIDFLSGLKGSGEVELRLIHEVSGYDRIDTIKTLSWEEIEAAVTLNSQG